MPSASVPFAIALDAAVAAALLLAAREARRASRLLRGGGGTDGADAGYWRLAAAGLAALALDELLGLHEAAGRAIARTGAPPPWGAARWDDAILAALVLAAAALTLRCLHGLRRAPRAAVLLLLGLVLAALAAALDAAAPLRADALGRGVAIGTVEELAELAAAAAFFAAARSRRCAAEAAAPRAPPHARAEA